MIMSSAAANAKKGLIAARTTSNYAVARKRRGLLWSQFRQDSRFFFGDNAFSQIEYVRIPMWHTKDSEG